MRSCIWKLFRKDCLTARTHLYFSANLPISTISSLACLLLCLFLISRHISTHTHPSHLSNWVLKCFGIFSWRFHWFGINGWWLGKWARCQAPWSTVLLLSSWVTSRILHNFSVPQFSQLKIVMMMMVIMGMIAPTSTELWWSLWVMFGIYKYLLHLSINFPIHKSVIFKKMEVLSHLLYAKTTLCDPESSVWFRHCSKVLQSPINIMHINHHRVRQKVAHLNSCIVWILAV